MKKTKDEAPAAGKERVSIYLDKDVLKYFRQRASQPGAPRYQTQINEALRRDMTRGGGRYDELLGDEEFIAAVAEHVRQLEKGRGGRK